MTATNLNIRTDNDIKDRTELISNEQDIPFPLKLDMPNEVTAAAIKEGRRIASDSSVKGYTSMDALKAALEAFETLRAEAAAEPEMTLDEINEETREVREKKKNK